MKKKQTSTRSEEITFGNRNTTEEGKDEKGLRRRRWKMEETEERRERWVLYNPGLWVWGVLFFEMVKMNPRFSHRILERILGQPANLLKGCTEDYVLCIFAFFVYSIVFLRNYNFIPLRLSPRLIYKFEQKSLIRNLNL